MRKATLTKFSALIASAVLILIMTVSTLFAQEGEEYRAFLSGANEVSPVFTTASGMVTLTLNGTELVVTGSFEDLSAPLNPIGGTGAHIHLGFTGQNGGVAVPLNPTLSDNDTAGTFDETATLTSEQIDAMRTRQLYVNIHSDAYPSGELRGQILPAGKTYFQTYASGGHRVPSSSISTAQGGLSLEYDGTDLVVTGSFTGLGSDYAASHLHTGFAGQTGGVEIPLDPTIGEDGISGVFTAENNTFTNVDASVVETLSNRGHYLNIHTQDNPSGEIRGQVVPEANIYFYAPLSGMNEIPQNASQATGAVMVEWYADSGTINATGSFGGLESDYNTSVGSHLHNGLAGQNGGVEIALTPDLATDLRSGTYLPNNNDFTPSTEQVGMLVGRALYVNVHTADLDGGEIRGQLLPLSQHYFTTSLTGTSEVEPVTTAATGGLAFEFRNSGTITATGSFSGLESNYIGAAGSHLHAGAAGTNGGVAIALDPALDSETDARSGTYSAADNTFDMTTEQVTALVTAGLYANVHSVDNPGGEVRGQVLLAPNVAPATAPEITAPADGATVTVEGESSAAFEPMWTSSEDANGDPVVYVWEIALDSEFSSIAFAASAGSEASLPLTIGTVDGLLETLGVDPGASVTIWHRATASDGSGLNVGTGSSVTLERGVVTSNETDAEIADEFVLKQNYPNPFNPSTTISYSLPQQSDVSLRVFDMVGREVATLINREQAAGNYSVNFDASRLSSGMYLYRLNTGSSTITRKMMLIK